MKHAHDVHLHLISAGVLDNEEYVSTNGDGKWKLIKVPWLWLVVKNIVVYTEL